MIKIFRINSNYPETALLYPSLYLSTFKAIKDIIMLLIKTIVVININVTFNSCSRSEVTIMWLII